MERTKKLKRIVLIIVLAVITALLVFVLRGPHISNALKRAILPELEQMTGRKVIAQKIYINLFPLFAEAKGVKVFEDDGGRFLTADRVKAYLDLSGLFIGHVQMRRLVIKEVDVTADRRRVEDLISRVTAYLAAERRSALKVRVKAVEIQKAVVQYADEELGGSISVGGLNGEVIISEAPRISASALAIILKQASLPDIHAEAAATVIVRKDRIEMKRFVLGTHGSRLTGGGELAGGKAVVATDLDLLVESVKQIFGLKRSGAGRLSAKGAVTLSGRDASLDLKLDGRFQIETLMELLKVNERVEGLVEVKGEVSGPLRDLKARGSAILKKGNLFDVAVDQLSCRVSYGGGRMRFSNGSARLYNGSAAVEASIALPVVNHFTVHVDFEEADSRPLFALIGWDPGIASGKVNGSLDTSGSAFNPEGWFNFRSISRGSDILGRVASMKGRFALQGDVLDIRDLKIETPLTTITGGGTTDIKAKTLAFDTVMTTADCTDVTLPYYDKLKGQGGFRGSVRGTYDDPVISGMLTLSQPRFLHYAAEKLSADLSYRKKLLVVKDLAAAASGEQAHATGSVSFNRAETLFDLKSPAYALDATLQGADLDRFARIFYPEFRGSGRLNAVMHIGGSDDRPDISGTGSVEKARLYGVAMDAANFSWAFARNRLVFTRVKAVRGKSSVSGDAWLDTDGRFSFAATSERMLLSDVVQQELRGDAVFSLSAEGQGTFDDPTVALQAHILEGRLKGKPVGSGTVKAVIREHELKASASLLNDKVIVTGSGRIEGAFPWEARAEIHAARYDAVLSSFLKDIPEDLILSLSGVLQLRGDRHHVRGTCNLRQLALSMYGYSFANENEISLALDDRRLNIGKVTLKSGSTSVGIEGTLVIGRQLNLVVEGASSLAPFKSLSTKIGALRGDAEYVLAVTGDWENPQVNGGVTLTNGSFGLKDYATRISSLNGYLYLDNDKVVLQRLTGKAGGGDVDLSGIVYLRKFAVSRFSVEAGLHNINASPSPDFSVNFGGNLLYKGTPEKQVIAGDLTINRARYRERIEWKSWLLKTQRQEKLKTEISGIDKAELNIRILGKDSILIDNNVARASVSADTVLRGTVYRPLLFGRIDTREGMVFVRNNEFRILHASAGFFDPNRINPVIDVAAETSVRGYRIKMNLEGQIDHFSMSLSSDPVLKEMDILSLLTVGQTGGEIKGLEGGIGAGEATSFLTGKVQDVLEERMRTITGLDRFQIDPHVSKTTGTVEPRVTVSKRLLGDKVFVTYASAMGSAEEQIIKLEYLLGKNVSLVGMRDERGITGVDVKFRFEFK